MTSFSALILGICLIAFAAAVVAVRRPTSRVWFVTVIVIALISSGASAFVASSRHAGTGMSLSRGYPKPYYFQFTDENGRRAPGGIEPLYFSVNTFVHLGAVAAVGSLFLFRRRRNGNGSSTIPGRMVVFRVGLGIVFIILGIVGSLLPVLQGWIFFLLAFLVLFPRTRMTEKILRKAEPKMPRLVGWLRRIGIGAQQQPQRDIVPE